MNQRYAEVVRLIAIVLVIPLMAGMIFFMVTGASSRIAAGLPAQSAQVQPNQELAQEMGKPKDVAMHNQVSSEALQDYIFCSLDGDGANDVPGQVDMTQMCTSAGTSNPLDKAYSWSWDEIYGTGSNTLDGCGLFDNDGDGNANYSICVRLIPDPAQSNWLVYMETVLYQCGDDRGNRCTQPLSVITPSMGTVCMANQQNTDPFPQGANFPQDTNAACLVLTSDVGGASAVMINACTISIRTAQFESVRLPGGGGFRFHQHRQSCQPERCPNRLSVHHHGRRRRDDAGDHLRQRRQPALQLSRRHLLSRRDRAQFVEPELCLLCQSGRRAGRYRHQSHHRDHPGGWR